jgi:DNA invertase Pin-like site-specific DNA recombinase
MQNIAIYYRVSTDRQDLSSQRFEINRWLEGLAADNKPKKIYEYVDEGISGRSLNRPGFKKMLDDAFNKKVDTIVVYRLDRFSRHATTAIRLILQLDEVGVAFVAVNQPVLNLAHENPFRRTLLTAFAEIAEIERETIVARVVAGLAAARKKGVVLGAPKKITPEKVEQAMELRNQGMTIRQIAASLELSVGSIARLLSEQ